MALTKCPKHGCPLTPMLLPGSEFCNECEKEKMEAAKLVATGDEWDEDTVTIPRLPSPCPPTSCPPSPKVPHITYPRGPIVSSLPPPPRGIMGNNSRQPILKPSGFSPVGHTYAHTYYAIVDNSNWGVGGCCHCHLMNDEYVARRKYTGLLGQGSGRHALAKVGGDCPVPILATRSTSSVRSRVYGSRPSPTLAPDEFVFMNWVIGPTYPAGMSGTPRRPMSQTLPTKSKSTTRPGRTRS